MGDTVVSSPFVSAKIAFFLLEKCRRLLGQSPFLAPQIHAAPRCRTSCYKQHLNTLALPVRHPPSVPPMNAVASPPSRPVQLQPNPHPPWEFTRRKRWADLIVTELSEAVVLVLSPGRKVLYCNPSVREVLGWLDDDLVDMDFTELVNGLYPLNLSRPSSSSTVLRVQ